MIRYNKVVAYSDTEVTINPQTIIDHVGFESIVEASRV